MMEDVEMFFYRWFCIMSWLEPIYHLNRGIKSMPIGWQVFVMCQSIVNVFVPIYFRDTVQGQATLVAFAISMILGYIITAKTGFSRLIGLCHLPWIPLLIWIGLQMPSAPTDHPMFYWMVALLGINGLSVLVDMVDVIRYIGGDREDRAPKSQRSPQPTE